VCILANAVRGTFALLLIAWFGSSGTAGAEVHLAIRDGRVTLNARDATVAEILAEWAKVGHTQVVNGDTVSSELISIELADVPESHALDVILRSVAGYVAVSRPLDLASPSRFDRILILPTTTQPRVVASTTPSVVPEYSEYSQYPQLPALPPADDDSLELAEPNPRGAVGVTYPAYPLPPPPAAVPGSTAPAGSGMPGQGPAGTPVPGMSVQPLPKTPPGYPQSPISNPQD
jgi:hypothetical protein